MHSYFLDQIAEMTKQAEIKKRTEKRMRRTTQSDQEYTRSLLRKPALDLTQLNIAMVIEKAVRDLRHACFAVDCTVGEDLDQEGYETAVTLLQNFVAYVDDRVQELADLGQAINGSAKWISVEKLARSAEFGLHASEAQADQQGSCRGKKTITGKRLSELRP